MKIWIRLSLNLNSDPRIEECALGWESRSSYVTMSKTSVLKRPSHLDRWVLQTPSGNTNWNYPAFSGLEATARPSIHPHQLLPPLQVSVYRGM